MKKEYILLFVIILLSTTMSGCWGKRELNEIGIVVATGVDIEPNGDFRITVISIQPVQANQQGSEKSIAWIGTATGKSIMDASKNLRRTAMRTLVWFHNRLIILSEELARTRLEEAMGYFTSNREIRLGSYVLISEERAEDTLQIPADIELNLAGELEGIIENGREWSKTYVADLREFLMSLAEKRKDSITARLGYYDTARSTYSTNREMYERSSLRGKKFGVAFLSGSAVIKENKMVGWMNEKETRGYMWIAGEVTPGSTIVKGSEKTGFLTLETVNSSSKMESQAEGDKVIMNIEVKVRGRIVEQTVDGTLLLAEENMKRQEQDFARLIENEMKQVVTKVQKEYNADIFGFEDDVFRRHPEVWMRVGEDWDRIFPNLEVRYNVEVTIQRTGIFMDPVLR